MTPTENDAPIQWITAAELKLPTDYQAICECSADKIESSYSGLEQRSNRKLAEFYGRMGSGEMRTLKTKLFFVAAMLFEQTGETEHKRQMVEQLRRLHRDNPLHPSVATIYRTAAPLKVWLGRKCGMDHIPSVGDLKSDMRPLLLLTEENILSIVEECKTARKFAEKYRPRRQHKQVDPALAESPEAAPAKPAADDTASVLIHGRLTPAMREKIAAILGDDCRLFSLNKTQAETASKWIEPATGKP